MSRNAIGWLMVLALLAPMKAAAQSGDSWTIQTMEELNGILKAQWMDIRVEQVEALGSKKARESARLHLQPFRWVPSDARRAADSNRLTYLIDLTEGPGGAPLSTDLERKIDQAMAQWAKEPCLRNVQMRKRPSTGEDADIFDAHLGYGDFGNWQAADVVVAGWMPASFFEEVIGDGAGTSVLALSVTFVFVGADGEPSDIDGDGYFDTAANEIYFNDGFSWLPEGGMDLESVTLHELGHSLGIGHLGAPPVAAMNPVYAGPNAKVRSLDRAAVCDLWSSWPQLGRHTH